MKKWIGPLLSIGLIIVFILAYSPFQTSKQKIVKEEREQRGIFTQDIEKEEKGEGDDPHLIQLLKKISEKLDEWLKSLNERIESEDVTRFEVRFFEILRNILEWVKEKVDAKLKSSEEKPQKKKRGLFQETYHRSFPHHLQG